MVKGNKFFKGLKRLEGGDYIMGIGIRGPVPGLTGTVSYTYTSP
jgi:hypothetical protein